MKETIRKTREYLDYIEEHYDNVQKAWADKLAYEIFDRVYPKSKKG